MLSWWLTINSTYVSLQQKKLFNFEIHAQKEFFYKMYFIQTLAAYTENTTNVLNVSNQPYGLHMYKVTKAKIFDHIK